MFRYVRYGGHNMKYIKSNITTELNTDLHSPYYIVAMRNSKGINYVSSKASSINAVQRTNSIRLAYLFETISEAEFAASVAASKWSGYNIYIVETAFNINRAHLYDTSTVLTPMRPSATSTEVRMKAWFHHDDITEEELADMSKEELQALAKYNDIKLLSVVPDKMRKQMYETWQRRLSKGDAFRRL